MSAQLKIYLPLNVEVKHLTYVIAKLNHHELNKKSLSSSPVNFDKPISKNNLWSLSCSSVEIKHVDWDVTILEISYENFLKEKRSFWFHTEGENDYKCILLPLNLENLTLLKRLSQFFGGKLLLEDEFLQFFKGKMKDKYLDSDDKFYDFYNLLNKEKPLTKQDHLDILNKIKISQNYHKKLEAPEFINNLSQLEYEEILSNMNISPQDKKRPKI